MTNSTKWPEPVAYRDDGASGGYGQPNYRVATFETVHSSMHSSTARSFTEPLYTTSQVREIVAAELEECAKLCTPAALIDAVTQYEAAAIRKCAAAIRAKIKEMQR
jgi:hypothetical protein